MRERDVTSKSRACFYVVSQMERGENDVVCRCRCVVVRLRKYYCSDEVDEGLAWVRVCKAEMLGRSNSIYLRWKKMAWFGVYERSRGHAEDEWKDRSKDITFKNISLPYSQTRISHKCSKSPKTYQPASP